MKPTIATRFRCSRPLTDLEQFTPMFLTLISQYLNKLVKGEVGNFTTPKTFHARKVQGFNGNRVKRLTKVTCQLPMEVLALVADLPIQACDVSHTPPPTLRTFLLTTQGFVEAPKFLQVRFQRLWVLFLLTRAECQVRLFHTEVCPNTLTRCWQRFRFYKVREYVGPIITARVTLYRDTADSAFKLTVLMERISNFIMSPFTSVPFSEIEGEAMVFQRPTHLFECEGFKLMAFLDFRSTPKFFEKSDICLINAPQLLLYRLTRQGFPMRVCRPFQVRQMCGHGIVVGIRQSVFIALTLPFMEVFMHLPQVVKQVANADCIRLIAKLILKGFHGISHITPLTPNEWVGRHVTLRLRSLCLPM